MSLIPTPDELVAMEHARAEGYAEGAADIEAERQGNQSISPEEATAIEAAMATVEAGRGGTGAGGHAHSVRDAAWDVLLAALQAVGLGTEVGGG